VTVDLFQAALAKSRTVFVRAGLTAGSHTIKITVAAKNASSTGNKADVDAFTVIS
jgi:hypothetical protein